MDDARAGTAQDRDALRQGALLAAREVVAFCAPGHGPHGGTKLVGDVLFDSPASALREAAEGDALVRPYAALAREVQALVGDQATQAVLLAARLVVAVLESPVPVPAALEGLRLAHAQAKAAVGASARPVDLARVLPDLPGVPASALVEGLHQLGLDLDGVVDLDRVDVRAERTGGGWTPGLVVEPQHAPDLHRVQDAAVAVCSDGWQLRPRSGGMAHRVRSPDALDAVHADECVRVDAVLRHLAGLGIRFLVCGGAMDPLLAAQAARQGILVWSDAPKDARRRIQVASGAEETHGPMQTTAADLGRADLVRRPRRHGGWTLEGPGPAATLVVEAHTDPERATAIDRAERVLRTAGALLTEPRAVPGGGRWQRETARALRRAADHAPGKAPITVRSAADVLDACADDLVRNAGRDPFDVPFLDGADTVLDAWPCVRAALDAGFETARLVLRLDGRYDKRPSTPVGLRGGAGRSGSPKGMPGDVPPLM